MGRVVEVFRQNTLERDELFAEKAQAAQRLEQEVKERTAELAQSVEELRALGEVSQAVNSTVDLETVLTTIVAKAVQLSGTEAGAIYVFDEASQEFRLRATYGMDDRIVAELKESHIRIGETAISEAASSACRSRSRTFRTINLPRSRYHRPRRLPRAADRAAARRRSDRRCARGPPQGAG